MLTACGLDRHRRTSRHTAQDCNIIGSLLELTMMSNLPLAILRCISVAAAGFAPSASAQDQPSAAVAGNAPSSANAKDPDAQYDKVVNSYLRSKLADPYTAHIDRAGFGHRGYIHPDVYTTWEGYVICYAVNAKNTFGAYNGTQYDIFVIFSGSVVGMLNSQKDNDLVRDQIFKNECSGYGG